MIYSCTLPSVCPLPAEHSQPFFSIFLLPAFAWIESLLLLHSDLSNNNDIHHKATGTGAHGMGK